MSDPTQVRIQDSLIPAGINGVINGAIAWRSFAAHASTPMTMDLISTQSHTVWGEGVALTFGLGVILSLITAKLLARHAAKVDPSLAARVSRSWPALLWLATGNAASLFGWFVALAVLWQRALGTIEVGPAAGAALVGLQAAVITVLVELRTKRALLRPA